MGALALPGLPDDDALRVFAAVPDGYRCAPSAARWVRMVEADPAVQELRADARASLLAVVWSLAARTDRRTATARPTWAILEAATCRSRSTVAAWLAWLRQHRLIGHVEQGSTPQYRRGGEDGAGNRAAVYVLLIPAPPAPAAAAPAKSRTPSPSYGGSNPTTRAQAADQTGTAAALRAAGSIGGEGRWPAAAVTATRHDRLRAALAVQLAAPPCRAVSLLHLRHLLRPYLLAGWTVRDVHYALDHTPDGSQHAYAYAVADLRHPAGWIAWRLGHWLDDAGNVHPPHYWHPPTPDTVDRQEPAAVDGVVVDHGEVLAARQALRAALAAAGEDRRRRQAERDQHRAQIAAEHHARIRHDLPQPPPPAANDPDRILTLARLRARLERRRPDLTPDQITTLINHTPGRD